MASVAAWDADDTFEGTNARVTYSILRNARHERTGEAIFSIHPDTGLVRTAVCCLDRETTTQYQIQVVATDGGGLQGESHLVLPASHTDRPDNDDGEGGGSEGL